MSMIKIENLTFSYPTSYDNIFENVNFQIDTDWKLGFVGRNGRGKTTLLNLLLGKYEYSGKIHSSVQFDYFPYPVADKAKLTNEIFFEIAPEAEEWEFSPALPANSFRQRHVVLPDTYQPVLHSAGSWKRPAVAPNLAHDRPEHRLFQFALKPDFVTVATYSLMGFSFHSSFFNPFLL